MRLNLQILLTNTTVIPFKWRGKILCFYCGIDLDNYDNLKKHTKTHKCSANDRPIKTVKGKNNEVKLDVSDGIWCNLCGEPFHDLDDVTLHLSTKHKLLYNKICEFDMRTYRLVDLKCVSCKEKFENFFRLIKHCNRYHATDTFICDECGQAFAKKRDIQNHMRYYHKQEYVCKQCDLKFTSKADFSKHNARPHHIICGICLEDFSSNQKRLVHMRDHFTKKDFHCGFCKKVFDCKISVIHHFAQCKEKDIHCRKVYQKSASLDTGNRKQVCAYAKNNFVAMYNMSMILPFHFHKNRFKCFFCKIDLADCDDLRNHVSVQHPTCSDNDLKRLRHTEEFHFKVDISSLSCKVCKEPMADIDTLTTHIKEEHKCEYDKSFDAKFHVFKLVNNNFPCLACSETFKEFNDLLRHKTLTHSKDITVCMYCGKPFKSLSTLKAHIAQRHHPDGYKCSICNLEFSTKHLLIGHTANVHSKKKVKCRVCPEKFTTRYVMMQHMIKAHGKGCKCQHCGRFYVTNWHLLKHIRCTHLKERNVECTVCSARFFDEKQLKIHMVKHIGDRKFICYVCAKAFLWRKNLTSHMAIHKAKK